MVRNESLQCFYRHLEMADLLKQFDKRIYCKGCLRRGNVVCP